MSIVTKQLALGNLKTFDRQKLAIPPVPDPTRRALNSAYSQTVYQCEHAGKKFCVVVINAYMGIGEVQMEIDSDQFPSKAALIRFYREVKQLTIGYW